MKQVHINIKDMRNGTDSFLNVKFKTLFGIYENLLKLFFCCFTWKLFLKQNLSIEVEL